MPHIRKILPAILSPVTQRVVKRGMAPRRERRASAVFLVAWGFRIVGVMLRLQVFATLNPCWCVPEQRCRQESTGSWLPMQVAMAMATTTMAALVLPWSPSHLIACMNECTSAGLHGTESDVCTHPLAISLLAIFYVYVPVISAYIFDTCNAGVCCLRGQFKFCSLGRAKIMSRNHICNM